VTLANFDYEFMYSIPFVITLYFQIAAWHGHPINSKEGEELGYAIMLTKFRAIGFMLVSAFLWFFMAEMTIAFEASLGGVELINPVLWVFYALFFLNLVVGIVMAFYLTLPTERLPKAFQFFDHQRQREKVPEE
jgi:hypothetical protein